MNVTEILNKQPILLFDGECGFCNRSILFFLNREKNKKMHFASLNSEVGKALISYFEIEQQTDSVILIKDHSAFIKSCAVLRLTLYMRGIWPCMVLFVVIPPFLRNSVYNFIAKRRIKFFGKIENCSLIPKADRDRFIDL